jgi:hypothetical protein
MSSIVSEIDSIARMSGPGLSDLRGDNPELEDYLDRLTAPMIGLLPYEVRAEFRTETQGHIERVIERRVLEGFDLSEATRSAIGDYGAAETIGDDFVAEWFQNQAKSKFLRRFGYANYIAFGRFMVAQLLYVALLQLRVFAPSEAAYSLPLTPAELRRLIPEPLPLPDLSFSSVMLYLYPLVAPIVAGFLTGLAIPNRVGRAVYHAMMPILMFSFVVGALLLPQTEGLLYVMFQFAYWLPVGIFSANLGSIIGFRLRIKNAGRLEGG